MKNKKKTVFCGVGTALVTPFSDGEIDYEALKVLIEIQISAGVEALIIGGTTGEAATLTECERYTLYERAIKLVRGRCKVILGTGTNDTGVVINHTKFAESAGADAALVVTPYYNKGTEEGIFRHYSTVADSTSLPIILYNVPSRTGVNLGINLLSRLAEHENIVGIKEASDSVDRLVELSLFGEALPLYAGNDSQIFPVLSLGGKGVISVVSNIAARAVRELTEAFFRGDSKAALTRQQELLPLIKSLFIETNPAPVKFAMASLGLIKEELRLPLAPVRESTRRSVLSELESASHLLG